MFGVERRLVGDIVHQDPAIERPQKPHDLLADMAATMQADDATAEQPPHPVADLLAVAQRHVGGVDLAERGQRETDHQLGDRQRIGAGPPPEANAPIGHRRQVDHVHAGAELADDFEARQRRNDVCGQMLERYDGHVVAIQKPDEPFALEPFQRPVDVGIGEQLEQFGHQHRMLAK